MAKQQITTDKAPQPGGAYSQCIKAGDFIFVAGQGPADPATGRYAGTTIEEQTAQTLKNIIAILAEAGASAADIVKTTVHLSDLALFDRFNAVYATMIPDPKPVRTTVGSQLPVEMLIEVDVIAYIGQA